MRNAALVCFLILIPWSLRAQDKKDDWKSLYGLRSGEKIELIETGMKKHVGTFSTVTEEAIQLREGSNDVGIRKESVARVTRLEKSHRLRNAAILGVVGAGAGSGRRNWRSGIEMFQFKWFVQLMWSRTRRRGRYRRGGGVGGRRRRRRRDTQPSHDLSRRASEIKYNPLTRCPLARVVRRAASPVLIRRKGESQEATKIFGRVGPGRNLRPF